MNLSNHIKDHLGLTEVAKQFNIADLPENGRANCPFCYGTKSLKTSRDQYFKCFKCGASGTVFDLLLHSGRAIDFSDALTQLKPLVKGYCLKQSSQPSTLDKLWKDLQAQECNVTVSWLQGRGVPVEQVPGEFFDDFAYWSSTFSEYLQNSYQRKELDILEEHGLYPTYLFENRVLSPVRNLSGKIVHFTGRSLDKEAKVRWLHSKGQPAINNYLYQLHTVSQQKQDYVVLCEGVTDCMSLRALGEPALACFGVNMPLTQHAWALKDKISHLIVILDRDKYPLGNPRAGVYKSWSGMVPNLIDLATELNIPIFCCMVPNWSGVKDVNDFLKEIEFDLAEFKRYLSNNSRTLNDLATEMYVDQIGEHDLLWSLQKHSPDPQGLMRLKAYIDSHYNSWADYILDKAV